MPYYCTVPQCTSMAGKAKNVSFHQFPRDEELARLWNHILKRGKPYTKYSKVCSLHFRAEDYTITSVGKNKGQWRTLRKDAIPSRNLPSEVPPTSHRRNSGAWLPQAPVSTSLDSRMQQQMAQAIYMQTMLAMQQASSNAGSPQHPETAIPPTPVTLSDLEQILQSRTTNETSIFETVKESSSYKCLECSKCFKDPDVFILHQRSHTIKKEKEEPSMENGKENCKSTGNSVLTLSRQETLRANPILANLLRSGISGDGAENVLDVNNILSIENQIMTALTANMESYIRNLSSMLAEAKNRSEDQDEHNSEQDSEENVKIEQDDDQNYLDSEQNSQQNEKDGQNNSDGQHSQESRSKIALENSDLNQKTLKHVKSEAQDTTTYNSTPSSHEDEQVQNLDLNNVKTEIDCSFEENTDMDACDNPNRGDIENDTEMSLHNCENDINTDIDERNSNLVTLADLGLELKCRHGINKDSKLEFLTATSDIDFELDYDSDKTRKLENSNKMLIDQKLIQDPTKISEFDENFHQNDTVASNSQNIVNNEKKSSNTDQDSAVNNQNSLKVNANGQEFDRCRQNGQNFDQTEQNRIKKGDFDTIEGSAGPICDS